MIRIGVDIGGTKVEAAALDSAGAFVARVRKPNPGDYDAFVAVVAELVAAAEKEAGVTGASVGVGMPGSISTKTGLMRNANSVWMNGRPMREDISRALGRPIRMENDANCFALSEATDGAAAGARVVFGAILGTGCGGGVVVDGRTVSGRNGVGGEWGHTPLPWPDKAEFATHQCWCGRTDCLETWASGSAFVEDYQRATGRKQDGAAIMAAARDGEAEAMAAFDRYVSRLGRALASMCNLLDPEVIVLGGGMSNVGELYERLPPVVAHYIFSDSFETQIRKAVHGDSSGVRGAAWLWPLEG